MFMEFNPCEPNGFTTYVMNGAESADTIIKIIRSCVANGMGGNAAMDYAFDVMGLEPEDLPSSEVRRIKTEVRKMTEE